MLTLFSISATTGLQTISIALPCGKNSKNVLRFVIGPREVGEKIGQTDKQTELCKSYYRLSTCSVLLSCYPRSAWIEHHFNSPFLLPPPSKIISFMDEPKVKRAHFVKSSRERKKRKRSGRVKKRNMLHDPFQPKFIFLHFAQNTCWLTFSQSRVATHRFALKEITFS